MAAEDAPDGEPGAFEWPVLAKGLDGVLGAGGGEAAARGLERRDAHLIEFHQQYKRENSYAFEDMFCLGAHVTLFRRK